MPKRILIAEDEPMSRAMMATFATMHGFEAVTVNDGVELLRTAAAERFDAIITDLAMGDLDGASATEIMSIQGITPPVIAVTSLAPDHLHLVRDKFTRIYRKPCKLDDLFNYLEILLDK